MAVPPPPELLSKVWTLPLLFALLVLGESPLSENGKRIVENKNTIHYNRWRAESPIPQREKRGKGKNV